MVMLSTPHPMAAAAPSLMIWCAAIAIACKPDEQNRLTVTAETLTGKPASKDATRATFVPCTPAGKPQPAMTSSTSTGFSSGVLRRTSAMQWASWSSGRVRLNEPRNDLASGVRELATTTASRIFFSSNGMKRDYEINENNETDES